MCSRHRKRSLRIELQQTGTFALLLCLALPPGRRLRAGPASASSAPITMQQAVDLALAHNPVLLAAQQNLLSMKGQEVEAGLRQNPDFSLYWHRSLQSCQFRYSLRLQFATVSAL